MLTRMSARFIQANEAPTRTYLSIDRSSKNRSTPPRAPVLTLFYLFISLLISSCSKPELPIESIAHAQQGVLSAALNHDGSQLAIGSINHGASLWTTNKNERLYNWNHKQGDYTQITRVRFSEDQGYVLTAEPQQLVLWDLENGKGDALWTTYSEVLDVAVVSGGDWAILALADNTAKLFDLRRGGTRQIYHHNDRVNSVDVHSESALLATASDDGSAKLWQLTTQVQLNDQGEVIAPRVTHLLQHSEPVQLIRFSPDGQFVFTMAQYDSAKIWSAAEGKALGVLPIGHSAKKRGSQIRSARFSNDGLQLLTGTADRHVALWNVESQELLRQWKTPKGRAMDPQGRAVLDVAFNADGSYSAVTSDGVRHHLQ